MPNNAWPGAAIFRNASFERSAQRIDSSIEDLACVMRRGKRRAFVEHHLDVGAKQALHLDGALGREQMRCAVDMRLEGHAVLLDAAELRQRHDLIAAGVGEDWPVPAHEAVQPAELGDALGAGPQHEMIGVGEDDVGAGARTVSGSMALTVAAVPTGMKAGVRITPRGVAISPRRARPSRAFRVKAKLCRTSRCIGAQ